MAKKQKRKPGAVIPIRLPEELQQSVKQIASSEGLSEADIMRMALARGLPMLERLFAKADKTAA